MRHVFYIDPLEKLNLKKDSTLNLARELQARGHECWLLFEKDLAWSNQGGSLTVHGFEATPKPDGYYLESFALRGTRQWTPAAGEFLHMRLDPPFDGRYLRYLWLLDQWERQGVKVVNGPRGIMHYNEKLVAYQQPKAIASWVGESLESFKTFVAQLKQQQVREIVLKPLDLYSGIGVEKHALSDAGLFARFSAKALELGGPIVAQPFVEAVVQGEVRAVYFKSQHLGSILKIPKQGEFISNIAHGGSFQAYDLPADVHQQCLKLCQELARDGIQWVAFDILGGVVTEANVTCPGLLTEVSYAHQKNLAGLIADLF